jgi:6-phosphogluconate dehydrogenase
MVPAGGPTEDVLGQLAAACSPGDVIVDGGNSFYKDSVRHASELQAKGLRFLDQGTSGGVWGLTEGLLPDGRRRARRVRPGRARLEDARATRRLPLARALGRGHYSKMVHNAIEYGMMQAYAEGFEILKASDYEYDLADLSKLWMQGSVVRSWLLELAGRAFEKDPQLSQLRASVQDSGEGRWTLAESIDRAVPMPGARALAADALPLAPGRLVRRQGAGRAAQRVRRACGGRQVVRQTKYPPTLAAHLFIRPGGRTRAFRGTSRA